MFCRKSGVYFAEDTLKGRQQSLRTKDKQEALRLILAKNEAHQQPALNRQIAKAYLLASDAQIGQRTWEYVIEEIMKTKRDTTLERWQRVKQDKAFDSIRKLTLIETQGEHFIHVLTDGTISTNVFLRRIHNFALDMNWLPCPIIPRKLWPAVRFKDKRAITLEEHQKIVARERNPETNAFYRLLWQLGGSQTDIATLHAGDIDWTDRTLGYSRHKTESTSLIHFGDEAAAILRLLPTSGPLFPRLAKMHEKHRAKEFKRRCDGLGISDITLHSYRYAWAERAKTCGYPERFAQQALGHNSKAVHRAYAKKAQVKLPSLEEYENKIIAFPKRQAL
jgi:integrase